jgi:glycosyltransferase involved in cell wall biosynthesis
MATNPTFSIIIPTYNAAKTIVACLDSIFQQTFTLFEVLVMDGASTDATIYFAINHKLPLHLYSEKDNGIYDAMNKGIAKAKGEWLYFLGSDDVLFNATVLEQLARHLKKSPKVIYGDVYLNESKRKYDGTFDFIKLTSNNLSHQAVVYHRSVFKKLGKYDTSYRYLADWEFNLRAFGGKKGIKTTYVDVTICAYGELGASNQSSTEAEYKRLFPSKSKVIRKYGNWGLQWKHVIKPWLGNLLGQKR